MHRTALHWFRRDLRLADNAALSDACGRAHGVACLFAQPAAGPHTPGPASRAWLACSLRALSTDLRSRGATLALRDAPPTEALVAAVGECGASLVTCTRDWSPLGLAEERKLAAILAPLGVEFAVAEAQLLVTPAAVQTEAGGDFRVFTPYWRRWEHSWGTECGLPAPRRIRPPDPPLDPGSPPTDAGPNAFWTPGETGAQARLARFVADALAGYETARDRPDLRGTSELSPHLTWGEISPHTVAEAVGPHLGAASYLRQLAWRDFAYQVAHANPAVLDEPLRPQFSAMAWRDAPADLDAWRTACTGYPLVDAGMRQLAQTGWMHNRVRLVAASLLTKHLLVRWQDGAQVFASQLADFDGVLNAFNWQWVAGSGADAAPYFRVFNPSLQGARFDPEGDYVRRWVPELAGLPPAWIHRPWAAPPQVLADAGVRIGDTYPAPIIDHAHGRARALAAFAALRA